MTMRRRDLLKTAAAGAAFAVIGLRRKSSSAAEPSRARRVLILHAAGGLRSSAAFNASSIAQHNPWGVRARAGALKIGNVLRSDESAITYGAPSWGADVTVPPIDEAATAFGLVAATDHAPNRGQRNGDHPDDSPRMVTGYYGRPDAPGLITAINKFVGATATAPVATLGGGGFETAPPAWVPYRPIELNHGYLPASPPSGGHPLVGKALEAVIDERHVARRRELSRDAVQSLVNTKALLRKFGPILADKRLRFDLPTYAQEVHEGLTNQMLIEAVGDAHTDDRGRDGEARNLALGLRLLQFGSPAVCVTIGGFDTHDTEVQRGPKLYTRFARFLAGVHFALSRTPEPGFGDGSMLDHTLVVTTSEFGRSSPPPGFNEGQGSDHGGGDTWRYQAHVVFGAGVRPNRLADTNEDNEPIGKYASTHALLATIAAAVGVPQGAIDELWPPGSPLYPEGAPLWDLWA